MLTRVEFNQGSQRFINNSSNTPNRCNRGWKWKQYQNRTSRIIIEQDLGCLYHEPVDRRLFINTQDSEKCKEEEEGIVHEQEDEAATIRIPDCRPYMPIKYQASVVFSDTYRVPQLLFQAYKPDGTQLDLDELIHTDIFYGDSLEYPMNLIKSSTSSSKEDKDKEEEDEHEEGKRVQLPILTKTIHPIDNQTYWGLHPCNTQTILKEILEEEHRNHPQKLPPQLVIESFVALVSSKIRPPQHYLL
ncbi:hypothetical protein PGT21_014105 [Puccinia graminis f. sp. tritici]|uniref:Ubiquitin-like-conjugating enzyme ATG10 n=1 Tax=Puccinia graminis f. sp. tritici TaxID=56615 RepID=A0A5B0PXJ5_PUCGR|nr:hypothetical protein PGTUg99_021147 [Puccinia graminis f. sp. tritici]KAA1105642.1 hypothetical protein PGT21_014105 [Puccinia graminis f. sp. tritici]